MDLGDAIRREVRARIAAARQGRRPPPPTRRRANVVVAANCGSPGRTTVARRSDGRG